MPLVAGAPGLTRVVIADDHPAVRAGLRALLDSEPDLQPAGEAEDAYAVPALIHRVRPDVVLLDYRLPGRDGISLCHEIKRDPMAPAVVVYSAFVSDHMMVPARLAGADAVVDKAAAARDVAMVVRRVAAGETLMPAIEPGALAMAGEQLPEEDLPILGMLVNGASPEEVARTLSVSIDELDHRIGRALGHLVLKRVARR
jgi:DNA-binding NarL/FixJ family response regulator